MNRIFLTLSSISNIALAAAYILGWSVRDFSVPGSTGIELSVHFLCGVAALTLAMLVHAIVLTYFMGTGRWIEETAAAYKLGSEARLQNVRLKYQVLPGMVGCLILWIVVGGLGAAADPGAGLGFNAARSIHTVLATLAMLANLAVSVLEYEAIKTNGQHIDEIMSQVTTIRRDRGLDVDDRQSTGDHSGPQDGEQGC